MQKSIPVLATIPLAILVALALSACAQNPATPTSTVITDPTDPYEATNRQILALNWRLDDAVIKPVAKAYRQAVHPWARARVHNFFTNLDEPAIAANRLLQGRFLLAGESVMRFVINSTLGLGGLFDLEPIGGPKRQVTDLGHTLADWGVGDGPYLMLPFVGPSNPRELVGRIGTGFMSPLGYVIPFAANIGRSTVQGLDERERNIETIEDIRNNSLDDYARLRSLWRQNRDAQLGRRPASDPDVLDDPGASAGAPPAAAPGPVVATPVAALPLPPRPPRRPVPTSHARPHAKPPGAPHATPPDPLGS